MSAILRRAPYASGGAETVQRQKNPGVYLLNTKGRLRAADDSHSVIGKHRKGGPAGVLAHGGKTSLFEIRGTPVENSWSETLDAGPGWIKDSHLDASSLVVALDAVLGSTPTLTQLKRMLSWATREQKKEAAEDDAFLARARKALGRDIYLELLPALGVHRKPDRLHSSSPGARGHLTGAEADEKIRAELQKEIANAVSAGRQVEGEVSVVGDSDFQAAFDRQWIEAAGQTQYRTKPAWEWCEAFVDVNLPKRHIWVHRSMGDLGTVIHEGMHKYADSRLRNEQIQLCNRKGIAHGGVSKLDEGLTEYFTRPVVVNQLKVPRADYYADEHDVAMKLATLLGRPVLVDAYFNGNFDAMKKAFGTSWPTFSKKLESGDWSWLGTNGYM